MRSGITLGKTRHNLDSTLRSVEKPPAVDEMFEQVSTRGVFNCPVEWVFQASAIYTEYKVQKIP